MLIIYSMRLFLCTGLRFCQGAGGYLEVLLAIFFGVLIQAMTF